MPDLPSGTVTFLFTDIEGSTKLWEAHPDAMRVALARHDALLRHAIAQYNGQIFKTIGDAFCAAFSTASDALHAALTAQLTFASEPWKNGVAIQVRMALHTGTAEVRDSDYFGQPLNRTARLLATGHGGQILLSQTTCDLTRDILPPEVSLLALGEHWLRDLNRPESIFQLLHPGLAAEFPPLKSLDNPALPNNLPRQLASFIGREKEIREVRSLLVKNSLLTLTGSGGCGKTRLSLQVAADVLEQYPDGVWLTELASQADPALVPQTVASALGLREQAGKTFVQALIDTLKAKRLLLVLDNCEHLLSACAHLCDALLRSCPHLTILASSREGLGIAGELTYCVPSLSLPDRKQRLTGEQIRQYEAVRLFVERAKLYLPEFEATDQNATAMTSICRQLDGIPLAIELAAARTRALSVAQIAQKLDRRFRLLTGGSRTALPRQQTLRALIDWSYDLLNEPEKALLCRLSVFLGGFTLETVEEVCGGEPVDAAEVFDWLTSLVDKSLIVTERQQRSTRYQLLETVRQYGLDRLTEEGDPPRWRDRHLAYFRALAEKARPHLHNAEEQHWLDLLDSEHDNVRAALDWSSGGSGDPDAGLALAGSLWRYWHARGHIAEGRGWLTAVLAAANSNLRSAAHADVVEGAGVFAWRQGDYEVARDLHEASLAIRRELNDQSAIASSLCNLGLVTWQLGDHKRAIALHEESLAIRRQQGDRLGISDSLNILGTAAHEQGEYAAAQALQEESLAIARELGSRSMIIMCLIDLGNAALEQEAYAMARSRYRESLSMLIEPRDRLRIAQTLEGCAQLAAVLHSTHQAAMVWGAAERLREEISAPLLLHERTRRDQHISAARSANSDPAEFDTAWTIGRSMPLEQAIELALQES